MHALRPAEKFVLCPERWESTAVLYRKRTWPWLPCHPPSFVLTVAEACQLCVRQEQNV